MRNQLIFNEGPKSSKVAIAVLLAMFIVGFSLWLLLYPIVNGSIVFWVGAVLMIVPGYVAAENLGSLGLEANFLKELPRFARMLFGVFWVLLCLLIFGLVLILLSAMVGA